MGPPPAGQTRPVTSTPSLEALAAGATAHVFAFVLGALLGSFANVCILRLPAGRSIVRPGSHCFACGAPVRFYDNLPVVSYVILRGRCRRCGARFSPRYLLVELATALLVLAAWRLRVVAAVASGDAAAALPPALASFGVTTLFLVTLVVITFIDLDHKKIPDRITYPGIPVFFALGVLLGDRPILDLAIGVVAGYGVVRLLSDGYFHLTKREGLGYGDGKLLALVGGLLGWQGVLFALFGGSLLGTVIAVPALFMARRRPPPANGENGASGADAPALRHVELPFGPFLAAAAVVYLFLEDTVRVGFGLG
jgi:leader peptidase (prepilin peptidase) / N-methyltransferase